MVTPPDPSANLRAELSSKIASAQFDVESRLAELRGALTTGAVSSAINLAATQLQGLSQLQRRIASADPASLATIRNEVVAYVAATQALAQQEQADKTPSAAQASLSQASDAARTAVTDFEHDFYGRRIFDPYLKFASTEDEDAYRHREEERRLGIEKALAEDTPEGNLRASKLAIEQMHDAGTHGADRSPDYKPMLERLVARDADLQKALDQKTPARSTAPSPKDAPPTDPSAALRAAGVTLADESDLARQVHARQGQSQRGLA